MINHSLLNIIRQHRRLFDFIYPFYEGYSIADIGPTVLHLLGASSPRQTLQIEELQTARPKKVINLVIDGFGYRHFINYYRRHPFLHRLAKQGNVYPITSVFPTTTPAALTTLHTGLTPQEHGLPEWTVYFEEFDSIIETLPFRTWGDAPDSLVAQGGKSEMLYEGQTIYQQLEAAGIPSYNLISSAYSDSAYSRSVNAGSTVVPFSDGPNFIQQLHRVLAEAEDRAYLFLYWGHIDATAHQYGPDSTEHIESMNLFFNLLEHEFVAKLDPALADDVLFLLTADHGHVSIKGEDIIHLNKYSIIDKNLMTGPSGKRILPTGSPHDVFLFIEPDKIGDVIAYLREELVGQAAVMTVEEALRRNMFGINQATEKFLKRIGNVIILPYTHYHVWYEFFPDIPYQQLGIHGGLSEDEMIVPLGVAPLRNLLPTDVNVPS